MFKKLTAAVLSAIMIVLPCKAYTAQSYALVEMETGRVLTSGNMSQRLPMASTTKIMTGLIACESGKLDVTFTVPGEATKVEGSSMGLAAGEKITLRDLTYGLMLESGNDAANAIAYCLSGSIPAFVKKMNEKAVQMKLYDTHFATPSGLDGKDHYTTALDLARMGAAAMHNREFAQIVSTSRKSITYKGIKNGRTLYNHNSLLESYKGAIGIKTGYIRRSGRCLVSCAKRDGVTIVAATLNCHDDLSEHRKLLDYGFKILKSTNLFTNYPEVAVKVRGGTNKIVKGVYDRELKAALREDELARVKMKIEIPAGVSAPVSKNQKLGEILFTLDGTTVGRAEIKAAKAVGTSGIKKICPKNNSDRVKKFLFGFFYNRKAG